MVILFPQLPSRGQCWWILVILCKGGQQMYWFQRWVYENVFLVSRVSVQLNYHISLSGLSKQLARKESLFSEDINRTIRRYSSRTFIWMATPLGFISRKLSSVVTMVLECIFIKSFHLIEFRKVIFKSRWPRSTTICVKMINIYEHF